MAGRKIKDKPRRFIRSAGGRGASAASVRDQGDTPVKLLADLVGGRLDPRDLSKPQRKAVLVLQANGKHTSAELAELLKVSPSLIRKDLQEIRRELGREVLEWTLEDVVGGMVLAAEKYQAHAFAQEEVGLAWSIERDKVKLLRELGVVGGAEDRDGVRLTLEVLGRGYDRAREVLGRALDPALTGLVVDAGPRDDDLPGALGLPRRVGGSDPPARGEPAPPGAAPGVEGAGPGAEAGGVGPGPAPGAEAELEAALERDLEAALAEPPGPPKA